MKRYDLSNIMRRAWELFRTTGKSFSVCLVRAWALYRLTKRMRTGVVSFCYEKANGDTRKAKGTLQGVAPLIKGTGKETPKTVHYFDIEAGGFRSFRIENFITAY